MKNTNSGNFMGKYLNENMIQFDNQLLRNFYLNKGYYNVVINFHLQEN